MYKTVFAMEMAKTADVFRVQLSDLAMEAYWEAFETAGDDDFRRACKRARAECEFMPTIRQIGSFLPSKPLPVDPLVAQLLQPWERVEPWPEHAVGRKDVNVKKAAAKWEPQGELEKAAYKRWVGMQHADWYGGYWPGVGEHWKGVKQQ